MADASSASETVDDLHLNALPPLPQSGTVREVALKLWEDARVQALWLGGSLANGTGDQYSDIDLRVAVAPEDLPQRESPDLAALFGADPLAKYLIRLGEHTLLHHLVLANGDILDLIIQGTDAPPTAEPILILGCRDDAFAARLEASESIPALATTPATGDAVREVIVSFWVNSHKHRKVLHRGLDLMFPAAHYTNWRLLMRLWYIGATGNDVSPQHFSGIHGLTALVRAVEGAYSTEPLALCGAPIRTRGEIYAAIERAQDVVAELGRTLAARYDVAYPEELEAVTRREWRAFRQAEAMVGDVASE